MKITQLLKPFANWSTWICEEPRCNKKAVYRDEVEKVFKLSREWINLCEDHFRDVEKKVREDVHA